ncbi:S-adenosyl-L-methionine-dependent methyltransferase [Pavlovales sp. CCMP2436]|nr:S-adenosyl-L-methionine-dependent methyltransferase [Pavlovales sp. CCMP2436]|mmetsp:Transcript_43149/g.106551  ORF Transcript_43149/g.106551 Transcript_43149/m.106551 type:complete len:224 (+) Transcript_43149:119-790(+)
MARYADASYWSERYTYDPEPFDWFQRFGTCGAFRHAIREAVPKPDQVLVVGAGTSRLAEEMFAAGYSNIFNLDISPVACKLLDERYERMGGLPIDNRIGDVQALSFNDASFDTIIDKGTLDALLCAESAVGLAMLSEISRVLRSSGGIFVHVTDCPPDKRLPLLQNARFRWKLARHYTLPRSQQTHPQPTAKPLDSSSRVGLGLVSGTEPDQEDHHMFVFIRQ